MRWASIVVLRRGVDLMTLVHGEGDETCGDLGFVTLQRCFSLEIVSLTYSWDGVS